MRLGSPSSAEKATSPSTASPASRLLSKLKSIASNNKAAASASGDDGVPKSAAAATTTTTTPSSGSSTSTSSSGAMDSAGLPNARASSATPPLSSRGPSAPAPSSLAAGSKTQAAAAAATAATTSNKKPSSQPQGSAWQCYRESRLSKIFLVSLFFVALYCGDLTPASMKSTAVFQGFSTQLAKLSEAASSSMPAMAMPSFSFAFLPARLPLPRRFGFRAAWNTVTDTIPPQVPIMTPMQSPALKRGAVLYAGDYIYSCVAPQKNNKKQDSKECQPTFLHLKDDGTLVLAHGSTPSKPYREIWASKTPKPCKNKGCSKKCVCQGQYEAVYGEDGALEVRQGDGKRVWRKRKWLQPKVLRPWPLTN